MRAMLMVAAAASGAILAPGCSRSTPEQRPAGPVIDKAELLPAEAEARLDAELRDYWQRTGRALVVATVPTLEGRPIERYATDMFNRLGIGSAKTDQGVLILVAPTERKLRIEVGYGLERTVTSERAAQVVRAMTPRLAAGDFTGGIDEGVDALIALTECTMADGVAALCPAKAKT